MAVGEQLSASTLLAQFDRIGCDYQTVAQERLDLANKFRSSLLPWRGQFSPELIELFLEKYAGKNSAILDPFVGSGTTLFEAARQGLICYAAEINPSAVEMASIAHFVNISPQTRREISAAAEHIIHCHVRSSKIDLFNYQDYLSSNGNSLPAPTVISEALPAMLAQAKGQPLIRNLLVNTLIRSMSTSQQADAEDFLRAFREHARLVERLPYSDRPCKVFHTDARNIPLPANSIDLVITSPPYINVFNYHQNNRPAMELIGWDLLQIARSEVGSNRKHRQNRFLTVIQYALDMAAALREMGRVLQPGGRAIVVVGRESKVRGVSFRNGRLVAALAAGTAGFSITYRQERKFKNKFGGIIYEDILHLLPSREASSPGEEIARAIAKEVLVEALEHASGLLANEIQEAMERAEAVNQSPVFSVHAVKPGERY